MACGFQLSGGISLGALLPKNGAVINPSSC